MATKTPSKAVASKAMFEAYKIFKAEGGQLPGKEITERIGKQLQ